MVYKESQEQIALLRWFKLQYPEIGDLLIGYPAGVNLAVMQRVRAKAMGLTAGVPDLQLLVPRFDKITAKVIPGLFIEMKSPKGKVSKIQKEFHDKLHAQNYTIVISYSAEEAQNEIKKYLKT
jgi:hypothetical protein